MKKRCIYGAMVAATALLFASCAKDASLEVDNHGIAESVTFSVAVPGGLSTRAMGDGSQADSLQYAVYERVNDTRADLCLSSGSASVDISGGTATVKLRLLPERTYDIVFWADAYGHAESPYALDFEAKKLTITYGFANDEKRDAFYAVVEDYTTEKAAQSVSLKRPFAQLNMLTDDKAQAAELGEKNLSSGITVKSVPNVLNLLDGTVEGEADVVFKEHYIPTETLTIDGKEYDFLAMNYLLVGNDQTLCDCEFRIYGEGAAHPFHTISFGKLPVQRNFRTNIYGSLITTAADFNVSLAPEFAGENENPIVVSDILALNEKLREGYKMLIMDKAPEEDGVIMIPTVDKADEYSITIPQSDRAITILYDDLQDGTNAPEKVVLNTPTTGMLTVTLPSSTVALGAGKYGIIDITTAESTLSVPKDVEVETLNVKGANVNLLGRVGTLTLAEGCKVMTYACYDAKAFIQAGQLVNEARCETILLEADVDLEGSADNRWTPVNTGASFKMLDGQGHVVRNLYVDNSDQPNANPNYYAGLFYVLQGDVKNLVLENATVKGHRGGVLVGRMDYGTVENCEVRNANVAGYQKMGGLVGYVSFHNKRVTVKDCSVKGCAFAATDSRDGLCQAGGLIGYLQTSTRDVLIEGNSVSGITMDKAYGGTAAQEDANTYYKGDLLHAMEQFYSHAFIGTVANVSQQPAYNYTVTLRNNQVAEQVTNIPTCDRTDEFIGWWAGDYNASGYPYTSKVLVNGETKDRWVEVKRLVKQMEDGGDVIVWRDYDFTECPEMTEAIAINKPTKLTLKGAITSSKVEDLNFENYSDLTIDAEDKGAIYMKRRVVMNYGTLTVNGGKYTTQTFTGGTAFLNDAPEAVMNLKNVNVKASFFAVAGGGTTHIEGGTLESLSSNKYGAFAYCVRAEDGCKMSIKDAIVKGIQGCIACEDEGTRVTIEDVTATAKDSEPNRGDAWYALYAAQKGVIEVISGSFASDRTPCCLSSDNDLTGEPLGSMILKGGKFSSKPQTDIPDYEDLLLEAGYKYAELSGQDPYKWEIVPASK